MLASIGQMVCLTTHANAFLAGKSIPPLQGTPSFPFVQSVRGRIGNDDSTVLSNDPDGWFAALKGQGFTRAKLFVEPQSQGNELGLLGFATVVKWAPLTSSATGPEVIWIPEYALNKENKEQPWRITLSGFGSLPERPSLTGTVDEAEKALKAVLPEMSEFQKRFFPDEPFHTMFESALEGLETSLFTDEAIDAMFPPGIYPQSSYRLMTAVSRGWVLGGMGWWLDRAFKDSGVRWAFAELTAKYYKAMGQAMVAACDVQLIGI